MRRHQLITIQMSMRSPFSVWCVDTDRARGGVPD